MIFLSLSVWLQGLTVLYSGSVITKELDLLIWHQQMAT